LKKQKNWWVSLNYEMQEELIIKAKEKWKAISEKRKEKLAGKVIERWNNLTFQNSNFLTY
jgi:hypothetical protein